MAAPPKKYVEGVYGATVWDARASLSEHWIDWTEDVEREEVGS